MSGRIFLVRHGQSTWNAERRIQGQTIDPPLTSLGLRQARRAAESLADSGSAVLLTSDAVRARQTAAIIGARLGLEPVSTALLRERHWGVLQGDASDHAWEVAGRMADHGRVAGGESREHVADRLRQLLRSHVVSTAHGAVVLVSHGDTIAVAVRLLHDGRRRPAPATPGNGEVVEVLGRCGVLDQWAARMR